jgi:ankyrin repeat protein
LVSSRDINVWTEFHWAATEGHEDMVVLLLARKSDVNATDKDDAPPLHSGV